jgi:hypothetical protein
MAVKATELEAQRTLTGALGGLLLLIFCLCLTTALFPFRVPLQAELETSSGDWALIYPTGAEDPHTAQEQGSLEGGQRLRLAAEQTGRVELIADSGAYVFLEGGAQWGLVEAWRRGTLLQHLQAGSGDYQIIIEQLSGLALYDLSQSQPAWDDMTLILRFPDGEFRPTSPCFQARAPEQNQASQVVEIPCGGEGLSPASLPTLP